MKRIYKKILALMLIAPLCIGQVVLAETVSTSAPSSTSEVESAPISSTPTSAEVVSIPPVILEATSTSETKNSSTTPVTSDTTQKGTLLQNTANTQTTASSRMLESTINPDNATTTSEKVALVVSDTAVASSSQALTIPPSQNSDISTPLFSKEELTIVATDVGAKAPSSPAVSIVPEQQVPVAVPEIRMEPNYSFALTGKKIPAQRVIENKEGVEVGQETVSAPLSSTIDNSTGVMTVSGQCAGAYYVVLLFKNANDYVNDRRSYVVNRAYPCLGGVFSYAISDLPATLPNGNYYLLVGEEGKSGAWKAITELTEISINKNE